ncbi:MULTISPECIES: M56 family metallopeptidase [Paenibacillus]|uniref:Peptidase M56 domain-containing protein n=1 Tax=Paenibacillus borealis TaxID=160799 RepID=A0ABX3HC42_PAEBO|nr:M56 family metallopeptidase [Paenibacillus borealis]OMD47553.1 hypothetical protein BSK56_13480 [Paenibacillus borealis]
MNVIYSLFADFLDDTLAASLVILVVIAIHAILQKVISARVRYLLWLLVIIRMLLPVIPDSPLSMFHVLQFGEGIKSALTGQAADTAPLPNLQAAAPSNQGLDSDSDPQSGTPGTGDSINAGHLQQADGQAPGGRHSSAAGIYSPWLKAAAIIWFGGAVFLFLNGLGIMSRQLRGRKRLRRVTDPRPIAVLEDALNRFGVKRKIPLYTGSRAKSPFLSGVFRPWIYVPELALQELTSPQLLHILAHELAHYKRRDTLWNLLGSAAAAIHWPNPLSWLGLHKMKTDRELACDAYVLDVLGEEEAAAYGLTLVEFLKQFSKGRTDREVLYFFGSQHRQQITRRVSMIHSFKKGSYRISAAAVLLLILLSVVTLTNASGDSKTDNTAVNDDLINLYKNRNYNRLDRAVEEAGFAFQAPSVLPPDFILERAYLAVTPPQAATATAKSEDNEIEQVTLYYERYDGDIHTGQFSLEAYKDSSVEQIYTALELSESSRGDGGTPLPVDRKPTTIGGINAIHVNVHVNQYVQKLFYIWERDGIVYKLYIGSGTLSQQEIASLMTSIKYPDEQMKRSFVNKKLFNVDVIDVKDLRMAADIMGFVPKFPIEESGFAMNRAMLTSSIEFSYPLDGLGMSRTVFWTAYSNPDVTFLQMQNQGLYETFKEEGQVFFFRIDGEKFAVPLTAAHVNGQEVLVTEPYKIDGELSKPTEPDFLSYFWQDQGVIYKVGFTGVPTLEDQQTIVSSFMKVPAADIDKLAAAAAQAH